jgi:molybdopterin converting factor subunit 1
MKHIKVLFFATLRDYVGARSIEMDVPEETTILQLIGILINNYPRLNPVKDSMMVAINREYAPDEKYIPPEAEIAFFPPVSGG